MFKESEKYKDLPYYIDFIEENDKLEVLQFLRIYFFPDEPLQKSLKLQEIAGFEEWAIENLNQHCSFKAVLRETGEIIGVRLNAYKRRGAQPTPEIDLSEGELKLVTLVDKVTKNFEPLEKYPDIAMFLEGKILCVDSKYRGLGIAPRLMQRAFDFMIEERVPVFRTVCLSEFSIRVMQKSGLRAVYKEDYANMKHENGEPIRLPEEPHKSIIIFIKELKDLGISAN